MAEMPKNNVEKTLSAAVLRARLENSTRAQEMNGEERQHTITIMEL